MFEQQHLAKNTDLERRYVGEKAQLERELEELKGVIARKSQSEEALRVELETLTQKIKSQSKLEEDHLAKQELLKDELAEWKEILADKAQSEEALTLEVENLKEKVIKLEAIARGVREAATANLEQQHVKLQYEAEEGEIMEVDQSNPEEACTKSRWVLEDELMEEVATYKEKVCELSSRLKECEEEKEAAVASCGTMESQLAGVREELLDKSKELSELQQKVSLLSMNTLQHDEKHIEKVDELEHVVQDLKSQLQITRGLLDLAKEDLEKTQKSEREKTHEIARLEADTRMKQVGHAAIVQQLITVAAEKAVKAETESAAAKQRPTSSLGLAELKNCTKANQRIAELEEASLIAADKLKILEACNAKYIKIVESLKQELESSEQKMGYLKQELGSSKQELESTKQQLKSSQQELESSKQALDDALIKVARLERKLGLKNERIQDLVEALDAANEKSDVAKEKLQATRLELKEERKANEAKVLATGKQKGESTALEVRTPHTRETAMVSKAAADVRTTASQTDEMLSGEAKTIVEEVQHDKKHVEKSELEHVVQDLKFQLQTVRRLLDFANTDLEEARTSKREMSTKIEVLEADVKMKQGAYEAIVQNESCLINVAEEKAMNAERELAETKEHLTSSLELAELNCTKDKERIAELEGALSLVGENLKSVVTCDGGAAKQSEAPTQDLGVVLDQNASLKRKLGQRNLKIEELVEALDAANAKYDVANDELQATRLELKEERRANESKMDTNACMDSSKRVADSAVIDSACSSRKKSKYADDVVEIGAGQSATTYSSSYDTWYQNLLYCVNMMIAAKGGSTGKWPLTIERASNEKMALSVLDKMMHVPFLKTFFKTFEVKMTNAADGIGKKKKKDNTMEHGLDAGGLTNDLLGKVFNGLLEIKVNVLGNAQKKFLFADDENAAWALPLEDHEVTAEAAILYEGVGRLFLKAILSGANTEADTPTLIPDTVFNPCFLHLCLDRGITKSDAGNCMMSIEDVRDALESLLPPDHFGLWSADALIDKSATMGWASGVETDADILVTHDNHDMYGRKFLERILSTRKVAFEHMKKGFFLTVDHERHGYIPPLKFFNSKQLRVLLCGKIVKPELILSTLNFVDGNHPDETGGEIGHTGDSWAAASMRDTKQWLLEFISQLDAQECEDFLNYCAAVVRIPYARSLTDGGGQSNFQIHVIARGGSEKRNTLPSAQTCFKKLSLPAYTTYNELQKAFKVAFEHAGGYFGKE